MCSSGVRACAIVLGTSCGYRALCVISVCVIAVGVFFLGVYVCDCCLCVSDVLCV